MLCAEAGALGTETELEVEFLGGIYNVLPNDTLAAVSLRNLRALPPLTYNDEETAWATELQKNHVTNNIECRQKERGGAK